MNVNGNRLPNVARVTYGVRKDWVNWDNQYSKVVATGLTYEGAARLAQSRKSEYPQPWAAYSVVSFAS